jgi:hypothetical protein
VIEDPRGVAARWPDVRVRTLATLAITVAETPWLTSRGELNEDEAVHAIALAGFFGHLNRIADAVGVSLDYPVRCEPPPVEPATPALRPAPTTRADLADLATTLAVRPATAQAIVAWRDHVFAREARVTPDQRAMIEHHVAGLLGQALDPANAGASELDTQLVELAERVTLAPWLLDERAYAALRASGFDDAGLFEVCVVASTAGMMSRIRVALAASR